MSIFSRYLFFRFFGLLMLALLCSIVIFVVIDFVENTRAWFSRPQEDAIQYYINYVPHIFYLILPVALLLAAVFSVGVMSRHLELVAMKAMGVSIYRILFPLLCFAVLLSFGMVYFTDTVLPDANHKRFKIKEPRTPENKTGNPNEKYKFVYIGPNNVTYFFQHYSGSRKRGRDVTILMEKHDTLIQRYDCKTMYWDNHWILLNGIHRKFENRKIDAKPFKRLDLHDLSDMPSDLVNNRIYPDEMRMRVLKRRINILKRSGESTRRFETQWHFKFASCAVNFIMVLIGVSLSANTHNSSLTRRFGVSLLATFCYFVLLRFGLILGENGELEPMMAAWMGNIVFGALGLLLFWRVGRL